MKSMASRPPVDLENGRGAADIVDRRAYWIAAILDIFAIVWLGVYVGALAAAAMVSHPWWIGLLVPLWMLTPIFIAGLYLIRTTKKQCLEDYATCPPSGSDASLHTNLLQS
ncbi:hypothetical protein BS78_05G235100 [Paspalum vaginatum]|nr:hypothetical protein BS78_05G235100 [Paspalum vaginatum]